MIPVDPTINLALIVSLGLALISLGIWVGTLMSRVGAVEGRDRDKDKLLNSLQLAMDVLNAGLTGARMDMMKGYAPLEYLRSVEAKIDHLNSTSSEMMAVQASQGATLGSIQETLRDLKAR